VHPNSNPVGSPADGSSEDGSIPVNEQRPIIQFSLPENNQSLENEVHTSNSKNLVSYNSNTEYRLPIRHNRGKPPKRFRPDEDGEGNYAIGKFMTVDNLPTPLKEFNSTLATVRIPEKLEEVIE
jgi:hypothetical protein